MSERWCAATEGRAATRGRHPVGSLRLDLRRGLQAPASAREAVGGWCPELDGGQAQLEMLLLLVSELVTNAVVHSHGPADAPIVLTASMSPESVRVSVLDAGDGFVVPARRSPRTAGRTSYGGYGLYVLDQAASRWGVECDGGTRVWFEL